MVHLFPGAYKVVFRIIVGVKYCFRYNARNRPRADENGDPIDLAAMPRQHRRRREKKLMTMDEVNERFPITKYKSWVSSRADQGLPTAGGVAAPSSRPASVKDAEGALASATQEGRCSTDTQLATSSQTKDGPKQESKDVSTEAPNAGKVVATDQHQEQEPGEHVAGQPLQAAKTNASTIPERTDEEVEEDEQIQMAVPTEMMATPGDSCAICIDTLEDDDDVRGLTCGHAFHASCVDPWLTSRRACCPLCKADYYVPKPRPEGDQQDAERLNRRPTDDRRDQLPPPPVFALLGGRFRQRMPARGPAVQPVHAASRFPRMHLGRRGNDTGAEPPIQQRTADPAEPVFEEPQSQNWTNRLTSLPRFGRRRNELEQSPSDGPTPGQLEANTR
ncbi:MAG: hypothetical protein MMC23_004717 [Stictis urceolatum]|nr:hypothetical protein [Stictis urceolata]